MRIFSVMRKRQQKIRTAEQIAATLIEKAGT
jgi:hypothetical protein